MNPEPVLPPEIASLREFASQTIGAPVWPFVMLDCYERRRASGEDVHAVAFIDECVEELVLSPKDLETSLFALIAVCVELLASDPARVEIACATLLRYAASGPAELSELAALELSTAGLSRNAIKRLRRVATRDVT